VATSDNTPPLIGPAASLSLVAAAVGDPDGTRTVTSVVALLVVLGIGLVMLAVWLFKLTRPDDELLAPLEVMGERKWRRADPVWQRRRLDEVRPPDAQPLQPSVAPPDLDEAFDQGPSASGFDDLHDHVPEPAVVDGAVTEADTEPETVDDAGTVSEPVAADNGDVAEGTPGEPAATEVEADRPSQTPIGIERPDDLPEREIDPALLAAAIAELDAELGTRTDRDAGT
jgi:hypothetical protein